MRVSITVWRLKKRQLPIWKKYSVPNYSRIVLVQNKLSSDCGGAAAWLGGSKNHHGSPSRNIAIFSAVGGAGRAVVGG
jgi:hypothetical protein